MVSDEEVGQGQVQVALWSWQVGFDSLTAEVKVHLVVPRPLVGFDTLTAEVNLHLTAPRLLASPWHDRVWLE